MRMPLIAGNWKMYKTQAEARATARALRDLVGSTKDREVLICPPFTALSAVADELKGGIVQWGGQNAHWEKEGAFTGEIAASMLEDLGCRYVIVGHSERRQYFAETDETVNLRMHGVLSVGITPIVCIGEKLEERNSGLTQIVLKNQIEGSLLSLKEPARIVIAYEPLWAIGTGKTASPAQAQETHEFVRKQIAERYGKAAAAQIRILYGGSVKPENMSALMKMPDIDGALVGGASLKADSFSKIVLYDRAPTS